MEGIWPIAVFLVLIFVMFYFLMIRPQRSRRKEHEEMMQQLKIGDRVITSGGIYGKIKSVSQDSVVLEVESGVTMRVAKTSIAGRQER